LLPVLVLGRVPGFGRLTRSSQLDVDRLYRGAPRYLRHVFSGATQHVALPDVLTLRPLGFLGAGVGLPGGDWAVCGSGSQSPVVQIVLAALTFTLTNLAADMAQLWLQPQLRQLSSNR
jgi:hypothetical protein